MSKSSEDTREMRIEKAKEWYLNRNIKPHFKEAQSPKDNLDQVKIWQDTIDCCLKLSNHCTMMAYTHYNLGQSNDKAELLASASGNIEEF